MSAVDFVKFQKSASESGLESSDSTCISLKIPENVEASAQIGIRDSQNTEIEEGRGIGEIQLLKLGRQSRWRNRASWCFAFVFLWTLVTTGFCLGVFMGNHKNHSGGEDVDFQEILMQVKSTLNELKNGNGTENENLLTSQFHEPPVAHLDQKINPSLPDLRQDLHHVPKDENEYAEVKGQLGDLLQKVSDLDLRVKNQSTKINNKIASDHAKLEVKLRGQHQEIKDKLDLKGQLNDLESKTAKKINSARDEVKKEISEVKNQMRAGFEKIKVQLQLLNLSSFAPGSLSAPPTFSTPQFFLDEQYKGAWFAPAPGWEKKCIKMPPHMKTKASSVKLGGHCLLICTSELCSELSGWKAKCLEIHPDSYGLDNLGKIEYNDQISSFRLCKTN